MLNEKLISILKCIECEQKLIYEDANLKCTKCNKTYRVIDDIPLMLKSDQQNMRWEDYFREISKKEGDTEAANTYFSVKNFNFLKDNILKLIGNVESLSILDVGCGTGHFSQSLSKNNFLVGIDISLEMLMFAKRKGFDVIQSSGEKLPVEDNSFDMVVSNNVMQLVKDGKTFIEELLRVAKPGGRIIVSTINGQNITLNLFRIIERKIYENLRVYTGDEIKQYFLHNGGFIKSALFLYFPFGKAKLAEGNKELNFFEKFISTSFAVEAIKPA
ncbi:MAG: methyltransferase domain-containing protein [Acidobacteriota bacterium]